MSEAFWRERLPIVRIQVRLLERLLARTRAVARAMSAHGERLLSGPQLGLQSPELISPELITLLLLQVTIMLGVPLRLLEKVHWETTWSAELLLARAPLLAA